MANLLCTVGCLLILGSECISETSEYLPQHQSVTLNKSSFLVGYIAEVEVFRRGITSYGRIIVTKDGCIHIEQLDEPTVRWFQGIIDQISSSTSRGWDNRSLRSGSVRCVWGNMAQKDVLAEIYTADASIRVYRHQLLPCR